MIYIDTGFLIALLRPQDDYHARAGELRKELAMKPELLALSENVLGEFTTFVRRKYDAKTALKESLEVLESERLTLVFQTETEVLQALELLAKYSFASYTDALTISIMQSRGIRKIASFDSEFDKVQGVERIF